MTNGIGSRQKQILQLLLETRTGLGIDDLAGYLEISRNAVKQHLVVLENERLIKKDALKSTGGRPSQCYVLTEQGINFFPKQYAWFCSLLLAEMKAEMKSEGLEQFLGRMGGKLANTLKPKFSDKTPEEKIDILVDIMRSLGYQATFDAGSPDPVIKATHCVYHDLAQQFPELCEFDRVLIATLLDKSTEQSTCMARQDCSCQFRVK